MTTGDIILHIFCLVDDALPYIAMHPQAKLYPSELVTIGILFGPSFSNAAFGAASPGCGAGNSSLGVGNTAYASY